MVQLQKKVILIYVQFVHKYIIKFAIIGSDQDHKKAQNLINQHQEGKLFMKNKQSFT